jgi:hypothetical protein
MRTLLVFGAWLWAVASAAQAVQRKQLITSAGGGVGLLSIERTDPLIGTSNTTAGVFTFRAAYALGDRWSLGVHYDRIGSDRAGEVVEMVRFTNYMLEGIYRPVIGEHGALEVGVALGPTIMSMLTDLADLPVVGRTGTLNVGVRYLHELGGSFLLFVAADHAAAGGMEVTTYQGERIRYANGEQLKLDQNSQRLSVGFALRF